MNNQAKTDHKVLPHSLMPPPAPRKINDFKNLNTEKAKIKITLYNFILICKLSVYFISK